MTTALRLALFDCDGTLVDSQWAIVDSMAAAFGANRVTAPPPRAVREVIGLNLDTAIALLAPEADRSLQGRLAADYKDAFLALRSSGALQEPLFPGVADALRSLHQAGILLGVATGKSRRGTEATLAHHALRGLFATVQTADDAPGKPAPDMVLQALAETGVDAQNTVVVGDTTHDMTMARAAGTAGIGVSWGYHGPARLAQAGADVIVDDAADVPGHVLLLTGGEPPCAEA